MFIAFILRECFTFELGNFSLILRNITLCRYDNFGYTLFSAYIKIFLPFFKIYQAFLVNATVGKNHTIGSTIVGTGYCFKALRPCCIP